MERLKKRSREKRREVYNNSKIKAWFETPYYTMIEKLQIIPSYDYI